MMYVSLYFSSSIEQQRKWESLRLKQKRMLMYPWNFCTVPGYIMDLVGLPVKICLLCALQCPLNTDDGLT